ncbi:hypothetical protein N5D77_25470 [Comamonas thiooxydans]|uniref:Uncharacterized protein n=1 Tax=Comamonas thiooxydans TaxID=363952 RepID=A0AA42Q7C8_9BURK|nr:hypothetical protein [Comamonas thiooxydans]MDH1337439.1 hypothetical protein [Comamonas thiooxydans]MDH1743542.1 hypothetical protein [Comamonas thiooxydans]MDH1789916.1 hypothetical protein [Comamonas thiooxydans]
MRTQEEINQQLISEIDSLSQQVTIAAVALSAAFQEITLLHPDISQRILTNFQNVFKNPAAEGKVTAERAKDLLALIEGTLTRSSK